MNLGDDVKDADDSSSDESESGGVQRKDSKLSTQVGTNVGGPSSRGSGNEFRSGSAGSNPQSHDSAQKMINNALPEDKEIHSDNEEEEE